jgi:hypothetical protein
MDYRHTEDFARRMEAAQWRAYALRSQAMYAFWSAVFALLRRGVASLHARLHRAAHPLPKA